MTTDERGRWFRVYARQIGEHPKFRDLTGVELGAWTALRSEAELRDRAMIRDRDEALLILRRRKIPRAGVVLDRLIGLRLFDQDATGSIHVHDREDHDRGDVLPDEQQQHRRDHRRVEPTEGCEWCRIERWDRKAGKYGEWVPAVVDVEVDSPRGGSTRGVNPHVDQPQPPAPATDTESAPATDTTHTTPDGWNDVFDDADSAVAYHAITGRFPSVKVLEWLNRLDNDHPTEAVAAELARQFASDNNLGTLLSRTESGLKLDAHRRQKADERARAKARSAIEAPFRKQEREATPEERERAKLQQQAIRLGLSLGIEVPTDPDEVRKFVMKHGSAA